MKPASRPYSTRGKSRRSAFAPMCSPTRTSRRGWTLFPQRNSKPSQPEASDMPEMPDFDSIMQMAQNAQAELQKAQDNLDKIEVEGVAGGGLIKVRATAKGRILAVDIDESLLQPSEKTMIEDLVAAAINDARGKADAAAAGEMQKMQSSLPLPPGFKLPF